MTAPTGSPAPGRRKAAKPTRAAGLGVGRPPRLTFDSRARRIAAGAVAALLVLGWFLWYAMTPEDLTTTDSTISATGVVGTPVYFGMFAPGSDFDRTIRISGVRVHATTSVDLEITPLLCRRGTVGVTTQPEEFCAELLDPEGQRLTDGDSIVLRIDADVPALAVVDQLQVAYREDLRWDTQPAGAAQAIVSISGASNED